MHGDIKAGNVLINDRERPLLCDFGLAKMPYCKTSTERKGAGTVRWQSPELWENIPRSLASDTYAFAMTVAEVSWHLPQRTYSFALKVFQTLTGDVPFAHLHNEVAVIKAVLTCDERPLMTPQASPTGISYENTWSVAQSCWSKLPLDRISMAAALQRLRADPSFAEESTDTSPELDPEDPTKLGWSTSEEMGCEEGTSPEPELEDSTDPGWSTSEETGCEEGGEASRAESWDWTAVEDMSL